jgi:hypothetical protein
MPETKTVNLLLANSEGRLSNIIETLVRDVCNDKAAVHCTRATHLDELDWHVSEDQFDLVIVIPEKLPLARKVPNPRCRYEKTADAIRTLKEKRATPTVAVGVPSEYQAALSAAGVDCVLDVPFKCDEVKSSVRELLYLPALSERESAPSNRSLFSWFHKLTGQS